MENNPSFGATNLVEISALESGHASSEPGLMVISTVAKFNKKRQFPLMIVNNTNKTIRLKKNCIMASANKIERVNINPGSDEACPDSKAEISTKLVAPKLGLFFLFYRAYIYNLRF
jgi:hypothetical protein